MKDNHLGGFIFVTMRLNNYGIRINLETPIN